MAVLRMTVTLAHDDVTTFQAIGVGRMDGGYCNDRYCVDGVNVAATKNLKQVEGSGGLVVLPLGNGETSPEKRPSTSASSSTPVSRVTPDVWGIESVVYGDGSADGKGEMVHKGVFYGSGKATGPHESMHPINIETVTFACYGNRAATLKTRYIKKPSISRPAPPLCLLPEQRLTRRSATTSRRNTVLQAVKAFCKKHPGIVVIVSGPGARDNSFDLQQHLVKEFGSVFMHSADENCVHASILNAVGCLRGDTEAQRVKVLLANDIKSFIT